MVNPIAYKGPDKLPTLGTEELCQKDLRKMMPPGAFIWVARNISAWCSRLPPMKQKTVYWRTAGSESKAAQEALQHAWLQFLQINGHTKADCPIAGLFPASGGSASSGA